MNVRVRSSDSGFTLTELVVVMALLGFILSISYSLMSITRAGTDITNREAWTSREIAAPLDLAERLLSQQIRFDYDGAGVTPWRCAFYTQRGGVEGQQRYVIEVPTSASDNRLLVSMDHASGGAPQPWSHANFNMAEGQSLFEYLDHNGDPITTLTSTELSKARAIVVTIVTEHEGVRFSDSRTIFFRNR